jgi:hypothetical protein
MSEAKKSKSKCINFALENYNSDKKAALVLEVVNKYREELFGSYIVIQPGRVRISKIK